MASYNINKYKKAKLFVKELTESLLLIEELIKKLNKHKKYIPVMDILSTAENSRIIIKIHLDRQKEILKNKGLENV